MPAGERVPEVVITGMGAVSALAPSTAAHLEGLWSGRSGVRPWGVQGLPVRHAASVEGFDAREAIGLRMLRRLLQPSALYAVSAAGQALAQAGLTQAREHLETCGLYVGSVSYELPASTFLPALEASLDRQGHFDFSLFARRGLASVDPQLIVKGLPNGGLCGMAMEFGLRGPNLNLANGAAAGLQALVAAAAALQRGECSLAVAGGYDSRLVADLVIAHHLAGELSEAAAAAGVASQPFSVEREGFVLGEGAAFFVLETRSHAEARGARPLARVVASAESTAPAPEESAEALEWAVRRCMQVGEGRAPPVQAVFVDGLGTRAGDALEAQVLGRVWPQEVCFTAATGALGFTGAAMGAFSFLHAVAALSRQELPPTVGCATPDPSLGLAPLRVGRRQALSSVLVWTCDGGRRSAVVWLGAP